LAGPLHAPSITGYFTKSLLKIGGIGSWLGANGPAGHVDDPPTMAWGAASSGALAGTDSSMGVLSETPPSHGTGSIGLGPKLFGEYQLGGCDALRSPIAWYVTATNSAQNSDV
jgi:hypothetical protein